MRYPSILFVLAAALLALSAWPSERLSAQSPEKSAPTGNEQRDASSPKVQRLQEERIAVLKELTDTVAALSGSGRAPYEDVLEAERLLAEAQLEAAATDQQRVELCAKLVDVLKRFEAHAEAQVLAARASQTSVLKAKARRLKAEIRLEQAKRKAADAAQPTAQNIHSGNSCHLFTKALHVDDSGVVAVPSRFQWSVETCVEG